MTQPIYAIGDTHGQKAELDHVLAQIAADGGTDARIVFLGDYVDRGPDSAGVIQTVMDGVADGRPWTAIKGNHDRYFSRFLDDGTVHDENTRADLYWFNHRLGGDKTLQSYGIACQDGDPVAPVRQAALRAVPQAHRDFLAALPLMHETDDLVFVHAGIRPGVPLDRQTEDDLIWIRKGFLDVMEPFVKTVVHGHTALDHPADYGNRVNLDGGAGYFRPLHAAVFEGRGRWLLTDTGRVPIPRG